MGGKAGDCVYVVFDWREWVIVVVNGVDETRSLQAGGVENKKKGWGYEGMAKCEDNVDINGVP